MNTPRFNHPTLVTLTAPTCAGKSYLLEALVSQLGFQRIVSTTDRAPRVGEIQGVHYDFISTYESLAYEKEGKFAELITFNGTRYGVTHEEMAAKMVTGTAPPMVILEPNGVKIYREYCKSKGWNMFTIFVDTDEMIRVQRLADRTTNDIAHQITRSVAAANYDAIKEIVQKNNKRLIAVLREEGTWKFTNTWDCVVDGTDLNQSLYEIKARITALNGE